MSFWDSNINQNQFPVCRAIKEKKFSVETEGVGELETKYDDSKKTLGLFQFLPSTLPAGRPLSHLLFCCPHTLGPHTSPGLCPCQPSLYPFQLFTQVQKEVYRILYSYTNTVKILHTVLLSCRCYSKRGIQVNKNRCQFQGASL